MSEELLQAIIDAANKAPRDELAALIAGLEHGKALAFSRLATPQSVPKQADELIGIAEASKMLGLTRSFLYHSHGKFAFTRRIGRKLLFSVSGIQKYIEQQGEK